MVTLIIKCERSFENIVKVVAHFVKKIAAYRKKSTDDPREK